MDKSLAQNSSDDDAPTDAMSNLKPRKEKVIQPINSTLKIPGADEDLLNELRQKTAELAEEMEHTHDKGEKIHDLEEKETKIANSESARDAAADPAVKLIRDKLNRLYKDEPDAAEEALESYQTTKIGHHRSKHQRFMYELTMSGKSLADIQTEWHNYYVELPDNEKHEVWKEFYETQNELKRHLQTPETKKTTNTSAATTEAHPHRRDTYPLPAPQDQRTVTEIKSQIMHRVSAGGKLKAGHHLKSLAFGLGFGALVGLILTFVFLNQVVIAPFISPSKNVSATPIISNELGDIGLEPKIIIPKINLEVPVVFDMTTIEETEVQNALENGVVHYASTPNPGEQGNSVIVGHSSNNIFNSGKYKFAFVLLKRLETDDTFFVHKDGIRYTYKVYKKDIVKPTDTHVLDTQERANTITLITCDPPGTSINRLVVVAEQISPDPSGNLASTAIIPEVAEDEQLPSNAPSLWSRIWPF